jgi:2-keto-4-pentenoate hydratase/2-oxohepta-3-ene-1,7-dioic acid hydratase in catechol pathway
MVQGEAAVKLVTYDAGQGPRVGVLAANGDVVDAGFDGDMVAFIEAGMPVDRTGSRPASGEHANPGEPSSMPVAGARLLAPLRPRSLRDFLTFEGHLVNAFSRLQRPIPGEWYEVPAYYKGLPDTVIGPEEEIPWPSYSEKLDHELELACVIGRQGKDISPEDALDHVCGWTIWNDVSARDVQVRELPVGMGPAKAKDWDGSNVIGPCLVTADELDAFNLGMSVRVNDETWGEDNTANMHHSFPELIAYASQAQTLYPGDVLGSGTAAGGSGMELDRWLAAGDVIEMEIEGIGVLRNTVGERGSR